ncbi:MAG: leucyl aminopeptidase family protein [Planctomycetota bacterium]
MFERVKVAGARASAGVLVLGQFKGEKLDKTSAAHDSTGWVSEAAAGNDATGDLGRIVEAQPYDDYERVLVVGLGPKAGFGVDAVRFAAGVVGRRLAQLDPGTVEVDLAGPIAAAEKSSGVDTHAAGSAFGEGLGLIAWTCDHFRGSATAVPNRPKLQVKIDDKDFSHGFERGLGLAASTNAARTLSQTPPNVCTPLWVASEAKKMARQTGMSCTVISGSKLLDEKLTGIFTVGDASENKPCLIRLEYKPERAKKGAKPVVLLGKTMTYDSGGLSIKVGGGMRGMKRDMDGGAAVFGAMHAIATVIQPRVPVVGLLVAAENAISDEAYRPDDVLTFRNGVTVEVTNTDAEGRLVLADGLCWAGDKEDPACIVDLATLTGGVVVALGSTYAGMWCDDDKLRDAIESASCQSGERVWRLPHHEEYRAMMRSPIADIHNSAPVREAHPIQGAAFLSYFCPEGVPWAHIDIAGTHATDKDRGPFIAGPTGFGVRLLAEMLDDWSG